MKAPAICTFPSSSAVIEDGGDSWRYALRPCCESAFLAVFHEHRRELTPALAALLREVGSAPAPDPSDLAALLRKDAVYNAVGLAAFDLYEEVGTEKNHSRSIAYYFSREKSNSPLIAR